MLRISVSDLESFRYWKDNEDSTLAELVARLTKKDPPTPQMEAGRALAKLFEFATPRSIDAWEGDGWAFRFELDGARFTLPDARELKAEVVFDTPSGLVTLVGMVDGLDGLTVRDQKLTEKFDAERYLDSLQWRAYLVMFSAKEFVYDIFVAKYERERGYTDAEGVFHEGAFTKQVTIREYHPLRFYAYPSIRADVQKAVSELAEVIVAYGIPKPMPAPAVPAEGATP